MLQQSTDFVLRPWCFAHQKLKTSQMSDESAKTEVIFGKNAVLAYLEEAQPASDQGEKPVVRVNKIFLANGLNPDKRIEIIKERARALQVPVVTCERHKLDQLVGNDQVHQGVVAQISASDYLTLASLFQALDKERSEAKEDPLNHWVIAVLDGVEDPHNLGAIVRVAEAAGVKALILPKRRAASLTGTVAKTSAGALAHLPIVRVANLVQALTSLKEYGFWIVGLSADSNQLHFEADLKGPVVLVIGNEGSGMKNLVSKNCDLLIKIPMLGKTESLNAAVAAGIAFYEIVRQRSQAKR